MKLKRLSAGNYETQDGKYYVHRAINPTYSSDRWWMVGEVILGQSHHLEDFRTFKQCKDYLTERTRIDLVLKSIREEVK
jgi:hypothetical protein